MLILIVALAVSSGLVFWLGRALVRQRRTSQQLQAKIAEGSEALRTSASREQLMFSRNPYPMWTYDCESLRFLEVNESAIQAYGYSREEFLQMTLLDIRPPEDRAAFLQLARKVRDGYNAVGVWRHLRKDGSTMFVEILRFDSQMEGRTQCLVLALDVTERCRVEEALRESESSLKALIDSAPFGIAQSHVEVSRFKMVNPALLNILGGYTQDEALQLNITEQVCADRKERDKMLEVLRRNRKVDAWEMGLRRRDGGIVPVRVTGTLSGGNGAPELFHGYIEDMTQQSALEQQVRQVQKLEAVGRLAGGMAHDFNNILLVIKLSTELMLSETKPESPFIKPLLQIASAADRAAALTRQMLAFGRQQILQPRIINLNSVVLETTQMLRRIIGEDIQLLATLSDTLENSRLDPDQVVQVILNLAVNARDAMPNGGTLQLQTETVDLDENYSRTHAPVQPGRYVMLAVSDTGTGIDKSILPRIFDPFFTTKEQGKGTGLGLSIVYGIVKQSGGYVWVYSEPGHGTTFKVYFPATSTAVERSAPRTDSLVQPCGQTLLVVEDDSTIRGNISNCLQEMGYRVLEAESATEALQRCEEMQGQVDLVLTDLVMGGKSGHQLAIELAQRHPAIKILFMSGYSEESAARREILLRGSPFLQKPFSVADLAKAVQDVLLAKMLPV
jgi:PAS domain S-box-containing protein